MASVFVLLEAFNRKEAAALGFFPCATASFSIIFDPRIRPQEYNLLRISPLLSIQIGFHRSVIDAKKLVSRGHHVDTVGLAFRALLVHELVDRLIHWSVLQDDTHH